ncbi:hypothetical protein [Streptomyces sp. NRRL B-24484]|uniref:hypothetical protein n=1 Tax=Streptomyces sp. NRRL B-24484 TaxID=1463833 RepID=UPI0004C0F2D2|nr:hypothetical protein [Streptomyces sp. NRRL B-24484]
MAYASSPTGGTPSPGTPRTVTAADRMWLVTLNTRHPGGGQGAHTFVERAATEGQAVRAALHRSSTEAAVRHRRDAALHPATPPVVEAWRSSGARTPG